MDDPLERLLWRFARRASERQAFLLALLLYAGVGLALPLVLGASLPWLIGANVFGTLWAGIVLLMWLVAQMQARDRRHLIEWTSDLRRLSPQEFEWLVGEVFRREGWSVEETGRQDAADGNIDLRIHRGPDRAIVQCKRWWRGLVGVSEVRELAGTIAREGLPKGAGYLVTLAGFTEHAQNEAKQLSIPLIDSADLMARVEKVRRPEACPTCGQPMQLGKSEHGWWFRCIAPGCRGKRDLARDPALAVDLLTRQSE